MEQYIQGRESISEGKNFYIDKFRENINFDTHCNYFRSQW